MMVRSATRRITKGDPVRTPRTPLAESVLCLAAALALAMSACGGDGGGPPGSPDGTTTVDTGGDATPDPGGSDADPPDEGPSDPDTAACGGCPDHAICDTSGASPVCVCDEGYEDDGAGECVDVDECAASDPCPDDRACENTEGGFVCDCEPDVYGEECTEACECVNGDCDDGLEGEGSCDCAAGWQGELCDEDIDECAGSPCDQGTCVNGEGSFTCVCDDGWSGALCDDDIDECDPNPCLGGVACTNLIGDFECACPAGFGGKICDVDIDECAAGPCLNGAICLDQVDGFICECAPGWSGTTCDLNVDECSPNPCEGGAACADLIADFACDCPAGTYGKTCGACTCVNGTCSDGPLGTGACLAGTCDPGYWGSNCAIACEAPDCGPGAVTCNQADGGGLVCETCEPGYFGVGCGAACSQGNCIGQVTCDKATGGNRVCSACDAGFWGQGCAAVCEQGQCVGLVTCDKDSGGDRICGDCLPGWFGADCTVTDTDLDGVIDAEDGCPEDTNSTAPGVCGCGFEELADGGCNAAPVISPIDDVVVTSGESVEIKFVISDADTLPDQFIVGIVLDGDDILPQLPCCGTEVGPGCANTAVQDCVCATDSYCCSTQWDLLCTTEVESLGCGSCAGDAVDLIPPECALETKLNLGTATVHSAGDGSAPFQTNAELIVFVGAASSPNKGSEVYKSAADAFDGGEVFDIGSETVHCGAQKVTLEEDDAPLENDPVGSYVIGDEISDFPSGSIKTGDNDIDMTFTWTIEGVPGEWTLVLTAPDGVTGLAQVGVVVWDGDVLEPGSAISTRRFYFTSAALPEITQDPAPFTLASEGETITLSCGAEGDPPPEITWTLDGATLDGAVGPVLLLENVTADDAGGYRCVATNAEGSVESGLATVEIDVAPYVVGEETLTLIEDISGTLVLEIDDAHTPPSEIVISAASSNPTLFPPGSILPAAPCEGLRTVTIVSAQATSVDDGYDLGFPPPKDTIAEIDLVAAGKTVDIGDYPGGGAAKTGNLATFTVCGEGAIAAWENDKPLANDAIGSFVAKRTAGQLCDVDDDCWSGQCDGVCQPTGDEPESLDVSLSGGGVTLLLSYKVEPIETAPHTVSFYPAADLHGSATVTLTINDGVLVTTHIVAVDVLPACEPEVFPELDHGFVDCVGESSSEVCTLRCDPGYDWGHPGEYMVFQYPDPTASCEDGESWTWADEAAGKLCRWGKPSIAAIGPQSVVEDEEIVVNVQISDPNTPLLGAAIDASASAANKALVSDEGIWVDEWCDTPRRLVIDSVKAIDGSDQVCTDSPFGEVCVGNKAIEIQFNYEGKPVLFVEGLEPPATKNPGAAILVCGGGTISVNEDDDPIKSLQTDWLDEKLGSFEVGFAEGSPCETDDECESGTCDGAWCSASGSKTVTLKDPTGDDEVEITYHVEVVDSITAKLHIRPEPDQNGETTVTVFVSDGIHLVSTSFPLTVVPACEPTTLSATDKDPNLIFFDCPAGPPGTICESRCAQPRKWTTDTPPVGTCQANETWTINDPPGKCEAVPSFSAPSTAFADNPEFELCDAFGWDWEMESICDPQICKWSGGNPTWVWAQQAIDAEIAIHNRAGLAERLATETPETVDPDTGNTPMAMSVPASCKTKGCVEDMAYGWAYGLLEVRAFDALKVKLFHAFFGGEVRGGRKGGECPACADLNGFKSASARLDGYLEMMTTEGPKTYVDEHFELPGEPLEVKQLIRGFEKSKSISIGGLVTITGNIEVGAYVGVTLSVEPVFAIPDYFGAKVTPTPFIEATGDADISAGAGIASASLNVDVTVARAELKNEVTVIAETGLCGGNGGKGEVKINGKGTLGTRVLQGKMTASGCIKVDLGILGTISKCKSVTLFTLPGWSHDFTLYTFDAAVPIDL